MDTEQTVRGQIDSNRGYAAWAAHNATVFADDPVRAGQVASALTNAALLGNAGQHEAMAQFRQYRTVDAGFDRAIEALADNPIYQRALAASIALGWDK